MNDWLQEQKEAFQHLQEEGVEFSFFRSTKDRDFDPITGGYTDAVDQKFNAPGIVKRINSDIRYSVAWVPETTIQVGDKVLLIGCGTYQPELNDLVEINSEMWRVEAFSNLEPALVPIICFLLIRRC